MNALALTCLVAALTVLFAGAESALAAPPATPRNFRVEAAPNRDSVTLTWSSGAEQVRVHIQKQFADGRWSTVSGYPRNMLNTGRLFYDTPSTQTGTFRFWIQAKQGSLYSPPTEMIVRRDLH